MERPAAQLASHHSHRLDSNGLDDPRIVKLRELLDQATRLLDGANELVADLTEQLARTTKDVKEREAVPAEPQTSSKS